MGEKRKCDTVTDLAVENQEMLDEARKKAGRTGRDTDEVGGDSGYTIRKKIHDEDIKITEIVINGPEGAEAFGKPQGRYVTIEVQGVMEQKEGIKDRASKALAQELEKLIPFSYTLKTLVVGLGNEKVTPDSLVPHGRQGKDNRPSL